jgi:hypothetical protein
MLIFIIYKGKKTTNYFHIYSYFLLFKFSLEKLNDLTTTDYFNTNRKNTEDDPQSVLKQMIRRRSRLESYNHKKKETLNSKEKKTKFKGFFYSTNLYEIDDLKELDNIIKRKIEPFKQTDLSMHIIKVAQKRSSEIIVNPIENKKSKNSTIILSDNEEECVDLGLIFYQINKTILFEKDILSCSKKNYLSDDIIFAYMETFLQYRKILVLSYYQLDSILNNSLDIGIPNKVII